MRKLFSKKQRGIGLLELMLSLAIIAVLLVMATRYYESANMEEQMNQMAGVLFAIRAASADYVISAGSYKDMDAATLNNYGVIPKGLQNGETGYHTPWSTEAILSTTANQVKVTVASVPAIACFNLGKKYEGVGGKCADSTFTLVFPYDPPTP